MRFGLHRLSGNGWDGFDGDWNPHGFLHHFQDWLSQWAPRGHGKSESRDDAQAPQPEITGTLIGTVADGDGLVIQVYGEETAEGLKIGVKVAEGTADLRGFFLDVGDSTDGVDVVYDGKSKVEDEGVVRVGKHDNNMKGTGEKFDVGVEIGKPGIGKDDVGAATFTLTGVTLDQLDDLSFGVRATSVGECRDDSVKLVGTFEVPEDDGGGGEPCEGASYPNIGGENILNVTYYFDLDASAALDLYTVRIDNYADPAEDLNWFTNDIDDFNNLDGQFLAYVVANDGMVDASTEVLGAAIASEFSENFYAKDCDETDVDEVPGGTLVAVADTTFDYDGIIIV